MNTWKAIEYAHPTSINAKALGFEKTGCWYVSLTRWNEAGHPYTALPVGCEGFASPDDPDLIACYLEADGVPSYAFRRYGNAKALAAIAAKNSELHAELVSALREAEASLDAVADQLAQDEHCERSQEMAEECTARAMRYRALLSKAEGDK